MPLAGVFSVGSGTVAALVSLDEVQAHLHILGAFAKLKTEVGKANAARREAPGLSINSEEAWVVFLHRAVYRFELWVKSDRRQGDALPPLDVLTVWHTFMLNPMVYDEDSKRSVKQLKGLGDFPLLEIAKYINPSTLEFSVPSGFHKAFEDATGQPFDPPLITELAETIQITLPCCENGRPIDWPWITANGDGWIQAHFQAGCQRCGTFSNRESFGVRRLIDGMIHWREAELAAGGGPQQEQVYLAGTMRKSNMQRTPKLLNQLFQRLAVQESMRRATASELGHKWDWKIEHVENWCMEVMPPSYPTSSKLLRKRVQTFLSHYTFPGPFSLDLIGAIQRQRVFVQQMVTLRWTEPGHFGSGSATLTQAVARYHAFLDLFSTDRFGLFVPTLDIDLVWHTHQLKANRYHTDTIKYLEYTPDHHDKIDENDLSEGFDMTAEAWLKRFSVPYTVCGCLSPSDAGRKSLFSRSSSNLTNERPDLITVDYTVHEVNATHPSEHNGVVVLVAESSAKRESRKAVLSQKKQKREAEVQKKGKAGMWTEVQQRRAANSAHWDAFFHPTTETIVQRAPLPNIDIRDPHVVRDINLADSILLAGVFVPGFEGYGIISGELTGASEDVKAASTASLAGAAVLTLASLFSA